LPTNHSSAIYCEVQDPQFVGRWLALAHKVVRAEVDARLVEVGGSLSTWIVLRNADRDPPLSQRELARALGVEGPTLVRHLDRLATEGLVERRRDPHDRRETRVHVTARGVALVATLHAEAARTEAEIVDLLPGAELASLRCSLGRVHEHFTALADKRAAAKRKAPETRMETEMETGKADGNRDR
jgi:MarR family transcriptional regulator for hemolysin